MTNVQQSFGTAELAVKNFRHFCTEGHKNQYGGPQPPKGVGPAEMLEALRTVPFTDAQLDNVRSNANWFLRAYEKAAEASRNARSLTTLDMPLIDLCNQMCGLVEAIDAKLNPPAVVDPLRDMCVDIAALRVAYGPPMTSSSGSIVTKAIAALPPAAVEVVVDPPESPLHREPAGSSPLGAVVGPKLPS